MRCHRHEQRRERGFQPVGGAIDLGGLLSDSTRDRSERSDGSPSLLVKMAFELWVVAMRHVAQRIAGAEVGARISQRRDRADARVEDDSSKLSQHACQPVLNERVLERCGSLRCAVRLW